jgi:AbrB family looped-hinge helix DNA binding protein
MAVRSQAQWLRGLPSEPWTPSFSIIGGGDRLPFFASGNANDSRAVYVPAPNKKQGILLIVMNPSKGKDLAMTHSTVTSKGQTTIPAKIRKALRIKPGDKVEYELQGDHATIRKHLGTRSLKGALASKKGKGMSFAEIREAAAKAARGGEGNR